MSDTILLKDGLIITPGWRDVIPTDHNKWAFIEALPSDAPPALLRSYQPLRWSDGLEAYVIDADAPRRWQYWSPGGWVELTGRVCVCERPAG